MQFGRALIVLLALFLAWGVSAQDQRSVAYEYDEAGNMVAMRVATNSGPPTVTGTDPSLVSTGETLDVAVFGTNLFLAQVTSSELVVLNTTHISDTELIAQILVPEIPSGDQLLTVTTSFGSADATIVVAESLPIISTNPSPILLEEAQTVTVSLLLSKPFSMDLLIGLTINDGSIVTLTNGDTTTTQQVLLPAGETEFSFQVSAGAIGSTELDIVQVDNGQAATVIIVVAAPEPLPEGVNTILSRTVGVRTNESGKIGSRIVSKPVGVDRRILVRAGESIFAEPVGVSKQ